MIRFRFLCYRKIMRYNIILSLQVHNLHPIIKLIIRYLFSSWKGVVKISFRFPKFIFNSIDQLYRSLLDSFFSFRRLFIFLYTLMKSTDLSFPFAHILTHFYYYNYINYNILILLLL